MLALATDEQGRAPRMGGVIAVINGVKIKQLVRHVDDRGFVMEILRDDDELFEGFGQAYVTTCYPGIVKAWHLHKKQHDNWCVLKGNVKAGLFDDREGSPTRGRTMATVIGELNPVLLQIPPGVWHGQMSVGGEFSLLLNIPTKHYDPAEPDELRRDPFDPAVPFRWEPESR